MIHHVARTAALSLEENSSPLYLNQGATDLVVEVFNHWNSLGRPLEWKKKRLTKHSDNKDYSTCNLQDVHDDIENEFLIFTRYMRRSILNSLNIFSHVGPAWQDSSEGEKVAVKVIDKTKLDTLATGHLFQEVRCMKLVQHPNIVRLYEVIDTQTKLYLILELGDGGDMFDYIMKHEEGLNEDLAKKYFAQIVHAISYCHKLHVVHRDLKPEKQRAPATSVRKDHLCEHPAEPQGGAAVRLQPGQLLPRHLSSACLLLRAAKTGSLHWSPFRFYSLKAAVIYYFLVVRLTT